MIATLTGTLFVKHPGRVIVDVGGVGYEVLISARTYDRLPAGGDDVFLFVYTSVREDAIVLFGFTHLEEKELFLLLNTVSGVGPKLALGILSGISASELGEALSMKNISRLTALPGVGKKTAQRLCVELQDKVSHFISHAPGADKDSPEARLMEGDNVQDAVSALINLGYPQNTSWQALRKVQKQQEQTISEMPVEELIRQALRVLA
ncbi:MAG TPA: Holliday junction branch migration protein RuvA [Desulfobacteraceae bacterium]|nr:Holliday junction branch migration protein RuvA [Desulfobacteraceae bacterium]